MDSAKFNLSLEPDDCTECGEPGQTICEAEFDELLKALDLAHRLMQQLLRSGANLDSKIPISHYVLEINKARMGTMSIYRKLHYEFQDLRREDIHGP